MIEIQIYILYIYLYLIYGVLSFPWKNNTFFAVYCTLLNNSYLAIYFVENNNTKKQEKNRKGKDEPDTFGSTWLHLTTTPQRLIT